LDRKLIELGSVPFLPKGLADDATGYVFASIYKIFKVIAVITFAS
jgi:hypothetical protein